MKQFPFFGKVFLWMLGLFALLNFAGCVKHPVVSGGRFVEKSDYEKDIEGKTEFSRDYLKMSPSVRIDGLYYERINYTENQSVWDQGFTVVDPNLNNRTQVWYLLFGIDPGDLQSDAQGNKIIVNLYTTGEKKYTSSSWPIPMRGEINVNVIHEQFQHKVQSLILFTQIGGTQGYVKMPPIDIRNS